MPVCRRPAQRGADAKGCLCRRKRNPDQPPRLRPLRCAHPAGDLSAPTLTIYRRAMTPNNETGNAFPNNQDFRLNRTLLRAIIRQRWRAWVACGLLILAVSLIGGVCFYLQTV